MTRLSLIERPVVRLLVVLMLSGLAGAGGCRLLTKTVACERDRDCPKGDAGIPYCTRWADWDAGVGVCTGDPDAEGDFRDTGDDDGGSLLPDPDGGSPFGDGGLPFLP